MCPKDNIYVLQVASWGSFVQYSGGGYFQTMLPYELRSRGACSVTILSARLSKSDAIDATSFRCSIITNIPIQSLSTTSGGVMSELCEIDMIEHGSFTKHNYLMNPASRQGYRCGGLPEMIEFGCFIYPSGQTTGAVQTAPTALNELIEFRLEILFDSDNKEK